jgi:hypothetical protein
MLGLPLRHKLSQILLDSRRASGPMPGATTRQARRNLGRESEALVNLCRLAVVLVVLTSVQIVSAAPSAQPTIAGRWAGDARLFDKSVRARAAPLPTEIRIEQDLAISGTVGDAQIPRSAPISVSEKRVEYRIVLTRPVKDLPKLKKSHMIVIVTRSADDKLDADFHLKSRFGFDPTMQVGHMDVIRVAEKH